MFLCISLTRNPHPLLSMKVTYGEFIEMKQHLHMCPNLSKLLILNNI